MTNHIPESAPVLDRSGNEVTVTERAHPLFGQTFPVVYRKSPGRRDHVLVQLPSGVRRAIPIAATSLAEPISGMSDRASTAPALVSIRTLLPLARLVRVLSLRVLEGPDAVGHCSTSTDEPIAPDEAPFSSDLAGTAARTTSSNRTPAGGTRPSHAAGAGRFQ
ncbi:MAG: hypothetical protein JOZ81_01455 [Chloroflexi bacterium]|nr:hypothetical protein [Chloroflexota bacterium]